MYIVNNFHQTFKYNYFDLIIALGVIYTLTIPDAILLLKKTLFYIPLKIREYKEIKKALSTS